MNGARCHKHTHVWFRHAYGQSTSCHTGVGVATALILDIDTGLLLFNNKVTPQACVSNRSSFQACAVRDAQHESQTRGHGPEKYDAVLRSFPLCISLPCRFRPTVCSQAKHDIT